MKSIHQWWMLAVMAALVTAAVAPSGAKNEKPVSGKILFQQHCASCHQDGMNKIKPEHPVAGSKELTTLASFKNYLKVPPGHMPYYEHIVNDEATLKALYNYCKQLKKESAKTIS